MREELLPLAVLEHVHVVVADVDVYGVVAVGTPYAGHPRQGHYLRMLAEPPDVSLRAGQACAVDAALLPGADADGLPVLHVAYAVALRVLQGDEGYHQVAQGFLRELLVLGWDVLEQGGVGEAYLVASLLEGDAEALFVLDGRGAVLGVHLNDVISTLAFLAKNLQGLVGVAGSDDAVAHLALDDEGGGQVARVAQGDEVTVGTHAVGAAGTGVGTGDGGEGHGDVIHEVDAAERLAEGQTHGCSGGRYVLERRGGGQTGGGLQFGHELPAVQCVEEIDVARASVQDGNGQFALFHVDARGLLVRVAPVL